MKRIQWLMVLFLACIAVFLRVCNLGTFSLWLDEVFTMEVASKPLSETLLLCAQDAENVPLYAVVTNLGLTAGLEEPWIRLLPITAGLFSIVFFAAWSRRHFGREIAWLVATFCVLSNFHIHYSQELRAYPYLLFMCGLTMVLTDRLRDRPDWKSTLALAATVAVGFYTNLTYALVLVPVAGMMMAPPSRNRGEAPNIRRMVRKRFSIAVLLGAVAFTPWLWMISAYLPDRISRTRQTEWTLQALGQRWEGLTVARGHFDLLSWVGLLLAVFFLVGIVIAARMRVGRWVLLPAVATLIVWEVVLVLVRHWSAPRYDTALWPFLVVLMALGFEQFLHLLRWRWLQWTACAAMVIAVLFHVDAHLHSARPHWNLLVDAVREVRRPGETVVALDNFSRSCLAYYLNESVPSVNEKPHLLRAILDESPSILVVSAGRLRPKFTKSSNTAARIARVPETGELHRLRRTTYDQFQARSDETGQPLRIWPEPAAEHVSDRLEQLPDRCITRHRKRLDQPKIESKTRLNINPDDRVHLRSGWGRWAKGHDEISGAWVRGHEASFDLGTFEALSGRIALRVAPFPGLPEAQWIRVVLNGHVLGERELQPGAQTLAFKAPARYWSDGPALLVLQFSQTNTGGAEVHPPRSAAVEWIEWTPHTPPP